MKTQNSNNLILTIFVSVLLISCSGGESGTGFSGRDSIVTVGAITGFGSVYVNGAKYDTHNAQVDINGVQAFEEDLALGMVVAVSGSVRKGDSNSGIADAIYYNSEIEGVVTNIDGALEVMGIEVSHDEQTVFESSYEDVVGITDIGEGAVVEVSGFSTGDNQLYATRIELQSTSYSGGTLSVRGTITALNNSASTFSLGNMEVFYDQSTQIDDKIPNQQLVDGLNVKVKSIAGFNQQGQLLASEIKPASHINAAQGAKVEMEGLVTNPNVAAGEFLLNGVTVTFDSGTEFKYGDSTNLTQGVKVEVEGVLVSVDHLAADEISFRGEGQTILEARVNMVDVSGSQVKVLGVWIAINNFTTMKDDSEANIKEFSIANISENDKVNIKAFQDINSDSLVATMLKRQELNSSDDMVELKGVLEQVSGDQLVVSGIAVDASGISDLVLTADDVGQFLTVRGVAASDATQITAARISL